MKHSKKWLAWIGLSAGYPGFIAFALAAFKDGWQPVWPMWLIGIGLFIAGTYLLATLKTTNEEETENGKHTAIAG